MMKLSEATVRLRRETWQTVCAILLRRERGIYTTVLVRLSASSCLSEAATLLAYARIGTKIAIYPEDVGTLGAWSGTASGQPCDWLIADQEMRDLEDDRAESTRAAARTAARLRSVGGR